MKYFSYHPCDFPELRLHDTAESAKARAEKDFEQEKFEAQEGWSQEVIDHPICWGEVKQIMIETKRRQPSKSESRRTGFDEIVEYELMEPPTL